MQTETTLRYGALAVVGGAAFADDESFAQVLPTYYAMVRDGGESAAWVALHAEAERMAARPSWSNPSGTEWTGARWYERLTALLDERGWDVPQAA